MKWTSRADSRCVNNYVRCLILWDMTIHYLINTSRENIKLKKPYTPFPSPQQPSKNDPELQSGKYSLHDKKKSAKKRQEKPNSIAAPKKINLVGGCLSPPAVHVSCIIGFL